MREIKFRAWDKVEKRFWYFTLQEILERRMSYRGSWDEKVLIGEKTQYTGLKDKDGREIYEGDIVRENYDGESEDGVVIFCDGSFNVRFKPEEELLIGCDSEETEIIGNIYENPELMEELQNGTK